MKTLLFILASFTSYLSFSQVTDYIVNSDSLSGCVVTIGFQIEGGPLEENGTLYFNWGDGTTVSEDFTIPAGENIYLSLDHSYAVSGSYDIETQVYSGVLGTNVDGGETETVAVNGATDCGFAGFYVYQVLPNYYFYNVPLDFTDNTGAIQTITPNGNYNGLNPANAPYNVSINDAWLSANNLSQSSADNIITSFGVSGWAISSNYYFQVTCDVAETNPDFLLNYGYLSNFVAPLETGNLFLNICNLACSNSSDVTVSVELDENFIPNTSGLTNASYADNVLTFDISDLTGCEFINIPCTFPGTIPAGTEICFDVTLAGENDTDLGNNDGIVCGVILNSYDPNDKQVNKSEILNPDNREKLTYKIQFQNDGNYSAVNVKVKDVISENLDLSTLKILDSKHGVGTSVNETTREITFSFNNIYLSPSSENLDGSQGYVIYSIEENDGLSAGTEIENTASIYFDFNPAIVTNTTYNINSYELGIADLNAANINMYPNPAKDVLKIVGSNITSVEIFDLNGKLIQLSELNSMNEIDIQSLTNGIYQVVIYAEDGIFNSKLIIQQ